MVTGANQGIGYEIASQLLKEPSLTVYVGARDPSRGNEALQKLNSDRAKLIKLDLNSDQDITATVQYFKDTHGGLDILVNNAAMAWSGDDFNETVARTTLRTNYFQTKSLTEQLMPLIKENGRVVMLSSHLGCLKHIENEGIMAKFTTQSHTPETIDALANEFITVVADGTWSAKGWRKSCYGIGKTLLNTYTQYLMRNTDTLFKPGVKVFSANPGWCQTRMSKFSGNRSAAKGAETPVWLALQPSNTDLKQQLYYDLQPMDW